MKLSVFIGRFQIFHNGHTAIIKQALEKVDHLLIIIGSSECAPDMHNPFSFEEREDMIRKWFDEEGAWFAKAGKLSIVSIKDYENDLIWQAKVQQAVGKNAKDVDADEIFLVGHQKDHTSYYQKLFPQWESIGFDNVDGISATDIRTEYFRFGDMLDENYDLPFRGEKYIQKTNTIEIGDLLVPSTIVDYLTSFSKTDKFRWLQEEFFSLEKEKGRVKRAEEELGYPLTFKTTDAVVIQRGHILMVKRANSPGKGLWALPGGYVRSKDESLEMSCVRELREETGLKVAEGTLKAGIVGSKTFDGIFRDPRGRFFTTAFFIKLRDDFPLEKLKPQKLDDEGKPNDVDEAKWIPLGELDRTKIYADHYQIIWCLINKFG